MTTQKERQQQVRYMLANKQDYLNNGTTLAEFNDRIARLKQGDLYDAYKAFSDAWRANHSISPAPSFTSWKANYRNK